MKLLRNLFIFHRHDARQHFQQRDLRPKAVKDGGEFYSNRSRPDDRQRFGNFGKVENFDVGEDELRVRLQPGEHARFRSGGDDDVLGFHRLNAFFATYFDVACAFDGSEALDPFDLVLLHQELDALGMFGDDAILPLDDLRIIQPRILALDTVRLRTEKVLPYVSRV